MDASINTIAQLGGTVFTVIAFLYYLDKNQAAQIEAQTKLAATLENLIYTINSNTYVAKLNTDAITKNTSGQ